MKKYLLMLTCILWIAAPPLAPSVAQTDEERTVWDAAGIAFTHPADWQVRDDLFLYNAVSIATDASALDGDDIPEGELLIQINGLLSSDPESVARYGVETLTPENALIIFSGTTNIAIEAIEINGRNAARADLDADGLTLSFISVELDDYMAIVFAAARIETFPQYEEDLLALVESLELVTPTLPASTVTEQEIPADYPDVDGVIWHIGGTFEESDFSTLRGAFGRLTIADDQIYVATGGTSLLIFSADGTLTRTINNAGISFHDVAVAADGTLWVIDPLNMKVIHMDQDGEILNVFGRFGLGVNLFPQFGPMDIVVGEDERIYILNTTTGNDRTYDDVLIWEPDGTYVESFPAAIRTGGRTNSAMLVRGLDDDLVTTWGNTTLASLYNPDGSSIGSINSPVDNYQPSVITVDPDGIILFEHQAQIVRYSAEAATFGEAFDAQTGDIPIGALFYPRGLGVLSNGDVVVADANETYWHLTAFAAVAIPGTTSEDD